MGYGEIIKRAWSITWRYRALWVLGLFAGVTGASSGGSSGGNSNYRSRSGGGATADEFRRVFDPSRLADQFMRYLPLLIAGIVLLVAIGLVLWILRIAARGGLVHAVDAIEESLPFTLGASWAAGFGRFWRLFGLSLLLELPVALLALAIVLALAVLLAGPLLRGVDPSPASFVPFCGLLAIGVPLFIVGGVILGSMKVLGERSIMLEGTGVLEAAGGAWRTFRARLKDTLIMWFITLGFNLVSGIVVAIPVVIISVALFVPAAFSASSGSWTAFGLMSGVAVLLIILVLMAYTAIWGTFTSALWTIFFRRLTGREVLAQAPVIPQPPFAPQAPQPPVVPEVPQPPVVPSASEGASL